MTDTSNVDYLRGGRWNPNVTVAERFDELALMARKHPERFERVIVYWEGDKAAINGASGYFSDHIEMGIVRKWINILGLIEQMKANMFEEMHGR